MRHPTDHRPPVEVQNYSKRPFKTAKPGDVGYDLYACIRVEDMTLLERFIGLFLGPKPCHLLWPVFGVKVISTLIFLNMSDTVWVEIRARSSTTRRKMQILGGTIDSGYQGELFFPIHNFGFVPRLIRDGERYAQAVFHPAIRPRPLEVLNFGSESARGATGFGSTGQ